MNIHNINTIARYEIKLLRRSWLFRIFAILAIMGITLMLLGSQTPIFSRFMETWNLVGLTSFLPFSSTYYYNIAQSIIIIFLAGSFLKRDKKLDTAEVIYVRPMSNADYIIGKTWGIMRVFIFLNIVCLLITAFVNLFITRSPFSIFPYIFYLLTISVPSLLFILGLSFTAMCLLKNQAVTFIVMLGITGMVFFYLSESLYGVFDFFGVSIPGVYSDVTGHADIRLFLLQRFIYLLSGIGLISFTIALVKRLPHRPWKTIIVKTIGAIFILAGCCAGVLYVLHYRHIQHLRSEYTISYNKYSEEAFPRILKNHITIEPQGNKINAESVITLKNFTPEALKNIILYLNPALTISAIEHNGSGLSFDRDNQVVIVAQGLASGEETTLTLKYSGLIDESVCYTDIEEKDILDTKIPNVSYRPGKRYAYLDDKFTLLTPECLWYPVSIAPANPKARYNVKKSFTDYTLTVVNKNGKTILSQGKRSEEGDRITFTNRTPLNGISLTIADYEHKAITVDSVDYELYYFRGHDFFSKNFQELNDTLPAIIREFKNEQEIAKGRDYPFDRFVLAETPVHFTAYTRNWKGYTEYTMPEIVFIPEKGVTINADFDAGKRRMKEWRHDGEGAPEEIELEINVFKDFLYTNFIQENKQATMWDWENQPINKFNISPLFFNHSSFIYSPEYPVIDIALNLMLNSSVTTQGGWWGRIINNQQRANLYLEKKNFKTASEDVNIKPEIFYELLKLKSTALKNYITSQISVEELNAFLKDYFSQNQFSEISLESLVQEMSDQFNINLSDFVRDWYLQDHTPTIFIKDVDANKVVIDDITAYQLRFKVNNPSDVDAIITVSVVSGEGGMQRRGRRRGGMRGSGDNYMKNYIVPAGTAKEIKFIKEERPATLMINTNISHNLPTNHSYNFAKIDNVITDTASGIFDISPALFAPDPKEIIIDNEGDGFKIMESNNRHKLKDIFKKEEDEKYKNFMPWRFPSKWTAIAGDYCYGETINSAVHKAKGSGANSVEWSVDIPAEGYYEVSIWNPKMEGFSFGRRNHREQERNQTYTLTYGQDKEDITLNLEEEDSGWVSIGNFYFPGGIATILLTDKVEGDYVIADAVKFTKIENE